MKTAVEWLVEQLSYTTTRSEIISYHKDISKLVEQAKEMEKEQIVNMIVKYIEDNLDPSTHGNIENINEWYIKKNNI